MANDVKYRVLVDTLKSAILNGRYDLDRPFPSERMLIRKYGHSRITVQHALRELERLGFISRQQGRGTFVTRRAEHCTGCGRCSPHCPQQIDIAKEIAAIDERIDALKAKAMRQGKGLLGWN